MMFRGAYARSPVLLLASRSGAIPVVGRGPFDPHRILGLPRTATPAEIRARYYRFVNLYHPDSGAKSADRDAFNDVHEAYRVLLTQESGASNAPTAPSGSSYRYHQASGEARHDSGHHSANSSAPAAPSKSWLETLSPFQLIGIGAALPTMFCLDPTGGALILGGGLCLAAYGAHQRYVKLRDRAAGLVNIFAELLRAAREWPATKLRDLLRRWQDDFGKWAGSGGPYADYARRLWQEIDEALNGTRRGSGRRRVRTPPGAASATAKATAATATSSAFTSAAADGAGMAASSTVHAPEPSSVAAAADVPAVSAEDPVVVDVSSSDFRPGGDFSGLQTADDIDDTDTVMMRFAMGADDDDSTSVLLSVPGALSGPTLSAFVTHLETVASRLRDVHLEDVVEAAATLPAGYLSTRLVLAALRVLVVQVCRLFRARE
jgi:hypothetical protein